MKPIDEVQLTAYALGELSTAERAEIEARLQAHPEQQAAVDEIRALAARLEAELKNEPDVALTDEQRQNILKAPSGRLAHFPWRALSGFAAVAAVLAIAFVGSFRGASRSLDPQRAGATAVSRIEVAMADSPADRSKDHLQAVVELAAATPEEKTGRLVPLGNESLHDLAEPVAMPVAVAPVKELESAPRPPPLAKPMPIMAADASAEAPAFVNGFHDRSRSESDFSGALDKKVACRISDGRPASVRSFGGAWAPCPPAPDAPFVQPGNTESYAPIQGNAFKRIADEPLSTFSIDVDTASYANIRRFLRAGQMPPPDAVRIEEMINYFSYDYSQPKEDVPFAVHVESAACPWNKAHQLVKIGLKGRELAAESRPACNLVFLLDVSGSMSSENKLPLVKKAIQLLARQLTANDRVSIVVYAGAAGLVLPSTPGSDLATIDAALERLQAGGSTAGGDGIRLAYEEALKNLLPDGNNRVVLCTDGDFNVGITDSEELASFIAGRARQGIFLTVLGFGMGNYKDDRLETLADKGNGNYAYIDSFSEARKNLAEQAAGTLFAIAKDVKLQIEFNPARFDSYRLVGYENRVLAKEDFNNDKKDAGELGAGHAVTAFYELVPAGVESSPGVDPLKYQAAEEKPAVQEGKSAAASPEWLTVKLRYKLPREDKSTKIEVPYTGSFSDFENASGDFRFAAGVAAAGFLMRGDSAIPPLSFREVVAWASSAIGDDPNGYRREFLDLLKNAAVLAP